MGGYTKCCTRLQGVMSKFGEEVTDYQVVTKQCPLTGPSGTTKLLGLGTVFLAIEEH